MSLQKRRVGRILMAKPGLDGHNKGAKIISMLLRNAGFEVIYTGLHQSIDGIVQTAIQEDVDLIGLSILSGAHIPICQKLVKKMEEKEVGKIKIIVGGNIPRKDFIKLKELGVWEIFPSGTKFNDIVNRISEMTRSAGRDDVFTS